MGSGRKSFGQNKLRKKKDERIGERVSSYPLGAFALR